MLTKAILAGSAFAFSVLAAPQDATTTTTSATLTLSLASTTDVTVPLQPTTTTTTTTGTESSSTTTTSVPPHYSAYVISAYRPDTPIHLLPLNAAGLKFWLGGSPATYCPTFVGDNCPTSNVTGFYNGCALADLVPGGQSVYAAPDGSIGFTQAHSIDIPNGSQQCPIGFSSNDSGYLYDVLVSAFGSNCLMACPSNDTSTDVAWQVFASLQNATVPNGHVSSCVDFRGVTFKYDLGDSSAAAWQYT